MEFINPKLLPKGVHEIIANFVPYDIYPEAKVIAYPRKGMGKDTTGHILGYAGYDELTSSYQIGLYPTMCCSGGGYGFDYKGTLSFRLWMAMLDVALHEIGHLATRELYSDLMHDRDPHFDTYVWVEDLANKWRDRAMACILQVNPRLGQPEEALTGYPGILAYRRRHGQGRRGGQSVDWVGINDCRGLGCGGQITISDIIHSFFYYNSMYRLPNEIIVKITKQLYKKIHSLAMQLGIKRFYLAKNGHHFLMFNVREAEAIYQPLFSYKWQGNIFEAGKKPLKWEFLNGNWELIECEEREKIPIEQLTLPGFAHRKRRKAKESQR